MRITGRDHGAAGKDFNEKLKPRGVHQVQQGPRQGGRRLVAWESKGPSWPEREVIRAPEAVVTRSGLCPVCDSKPQEGFERGGEGDTVQSANFKTRPGGGVGS